MLMSRYKKFKSIVLAVLLLVIILLTGTYAWTQFNNVGFGALYTETNFGGRFHFNAEGVNAGRHNQDLFAENFGENQLFVRARIREHMLVAGAPVVAYIVVDGQYRDVDLNDVRTWPIFEVASNNLRLRKPNTPAAMIGQSGVTFGLGDYGNNRKVFMPTHNQATTRARSGIHPSGLGHNIFADFIIDDAVARDAYRMIHATGTAVDAIAGGFNLTDVDDSRDIMTSYDEFGNRVSGGWQTGVGDGTHNDWTVDAQLCEYVIYVDADGFLTHTSEPECHSGQETLSPDMRDEDILQVWESNVAPEFGGIMTMTQWDAIGNPRGDFWVIDTENPGGWIYWATPLEPGQATSLLLDEIEVVDLNDEGIEYVLQVETDFVIGSYIGHLDEISDDALNLWNATLGSNRLQIEFDTDVDNLVIERGDSRTLQATLMQVPGITTVNPFLALFGTNSGTVIDGTVFEWSILEPTQDSSVEDGVIEIGLDEQYDELTLIVYENIHHVTTQITIHIIDLVEPPEPGPVHEYLMRWIEMPAQQVDLCETIELRQRRLQAELVRLYEDYSVEVITNGGFEWAILEPGFNAHSTVVGSLVSDEGLVTIHPEETEERVTVRASIEHENNDIYVDAVFDLSNRLVIPDIPGQQFTDPCSDSNTVWRFLRDEGDYSLIITEYVHGVTHIRNSARGVAFHHSNTFSPWESSDIRDEINTWYQIDANVSPLMRSRARVGATPTERELPTQSGWSRTANIIAARSYPSETAEVGEPFLLSISDVTQNFGVGNSGRQAHGLGTATNRPWWVRSPGNTTLNNRSHVAASGSVERRNSTSITSVTGFRPALWVRRSPETGYIVRFEVPAPTNPISVCGNGSELQRQYPAPWLLKENDDGSLETLATGGFTWNIIQPGPDSQSTYAGSTITNDGLVTVSKSETEHALTLRASIEHDGVWHHMNVTLHVSDILILPTELGETFTDYCSGIEWRLLRNSGDHALLLTEYVHNIGLPYHSDNNFVMWEDNPGIRAELETWYGQYTSSALQALAVSATTPVERTNSTDPGWSTDEINEIALTTPSGNPGNGMPFMLSISDVNDTLGIPGDGRTTPGVGSATNRGWWLRSAGSSATAQQARVTNAGAIAGMNATNTSTSISSATGMRPALWVRRLAQPGYSISWLTPPSVQPMSVCGPEEARQRQFPAPHLVYEDADWNIDIIATGGFTWSILEPGLLPHTTVSGSFINGDGLLTISNLETEEDLTIRVSHTHEGVTRHLDTTINVSDRLSIPEVPHETFVDYCNGTVWRLLHSEDNYALIITENTYGINNTTTGILYHNTNTFIPWEENPEIRTNALMNWYNSDVNVDQRIRDIALNGTTPIERSDPTDVFPPFSTNTNEVFARTEPSGMIGQGEPFFLSISDANEFFSGATGNEGRQAFRFGGTANRGWWLRSPGTGTTAQTWVDAEGVINASNANTGSSTTVGAFRGMRPALWIRQAPAPGYSLIWDEPVSVTPISVCGNMIDRQRQMPTLHLIRENEDLSVETVATDGFVWSILNDGLSAHSTYAGSFINGNGLLTISNLETEEDLTIRVSHTYEGVTRHLNTTINVRDRLSIPDNPHETFIDYCNGTIWRLLHSEDNYALIITENTYGINNTTTGVSYHGTNTFIPWEDNPAIRTSALMNWYNSDVNVDQRIRDIALNGTTPIERSNPADAFPPFAAGVNEVFARTRPTGVVGQGEPFFLSISDANEFFNGATGNEGRQAARFGDNVSRGWWLRSPGSGTVAQTWVNSDGVISTSNADAGSATSAIAFRGMRPALWIRRVPTPGYSLVWNTPVSRTPISVCGNETGRQRQMPSLSLIRENEDLSVETIATDGFIWTILNDGLSTHTTYAGSHVNENGLLTLSNLETEENLTIRVSHTYEDITRYLDTTINVRDQLSIPTNPHETFVDYCNGTIWRYLHGEDNYALIITEHIHHTPTPYHSTVPFLPWEQNPEIRTGQLATLFTNDTIVSQRLRDITLDGTTPIERSDPTDAFPPFSASVNESFARTKPTGIVGQGQPFFLSISDANEFFDGTTGQTGKQAQNTSGGTNHRSWWLRSPGENATNTIARVDRNGVVSAQGAATTSASPTSLNNTGLRPALWIRRTPTPGYSLVWDAPVSRTPISVCGNETERQRQLPSLRLIRENENLSVETVATNGFVWSILNDGLSTHTTYAGSHVDEDGLLIISNVETEEDLTIRVSHTYEGITRYLDTTINVRDRLSIPDTPHETFIDYCNGTIWRYLHSEDNHALIITEHNYGVNNSTTGILYHSANTFIPWEHNPAIRSGALTTWYSDNINVSQRIRDIALSGTTSTERSDPANTFPAFSANVNEAFARTEPSGIVGQGEPFFLSISDANEFFSGAAGTTGRQSARFGGTATRGWWLRSPGSGTAAQTWVNADGVIATSNANAGSSTTVANFRGMRPALWVRRTPTSGGYSLIWDTPVSRTPISVCGNETDRQHQMPSLRLIRENEDLSVDTIATGGFFWSILEDGLYPHMTHIGSYINQTGLLTLSNLETEPYLTIRVSHTHGGTTRYLDTVIPTRDQLQIPSTPHETFIDYCNGTVWRYLRSEDNYALIITEHIYNAPTRYHSAVPFVPWEQNPEIRTGAMTTLFANDTIISQRLRDITLDGTTPIERANSTAPDWSPAAENESALTKPNGNIGNGSPFLLSISDINYSFIGATGSTGRQAQNTNGGTNHRSWWLRSPGNNATTTIARVDRNGAISTQNPTVTSATASNINNTGLRPAIWIRRVTPPIEFDLNPIITLHLITETLHSLNIALFTEEDKAEKSIGSK